MKVAQHRTASFKGLVAVSAMASRIARAASAKRDTKPELLLRLALSRAGVRYRVDVSTITGRPDVVFPSAKLAVFCDGDFWHGRNIRTRVNRLAKGHNASYWISKIRTNIARDKRVDRILNKAGWAVLRLWETDIRSDPAAAAEVVLKTLRVRDRQRPGSNPSTRRPK
jgi:DNA mismatch endonuclease (patch repair protein)